MILWELCLDSTSINLAMRGHKSILTLFKIKINHTFPYGYVNVISYNGTTSDGKGTHEIRATLVYSSVREKILLKNGGIRW